MVEVKVCSIDLLFVIISSNYSHLLMLKTYVISQNQPILTPNKSDGVVSLLQSLLEAPLECSSII